MADFDPTKIDFAKMPNVLEGKPEISYPCAWEYRIIADSETKIQEAVSQILKTPYRRESKNKSSNGRCVSMCLSTSVDSEAYRNEIYSYLTSHPDIKMVI